MPPQLIVNADDFGISRAVNAAVILAHREGVLTSASLLVTGEAAGEALELARRNPELAVGLHLALCDARPALPPDELPALTGRDGRLEADPARAGLHWTISGAARRQLRREIVAQFDRFAATGLSLSHVDGHHHLHLHPAAFPLVAELAARHGARGVRLPDEGLASLHHARPPWAAAEAMAVSLLARRWRALARRRGLAFAGEVHGILRSGRMRADYLASLLWRLERGSAEIYLHPSTERTHPRGANPEELAALLDPEVREAIQARGLRLATYRSLSTA
jgi:hopanoid biosynthesis associated protein HpnK